MSTYNILKNILWADLIRDGLSNRPSLTLICALYFPFIKLIIIL